MSFVSGRCFVYGGLQGGMEELLAFRVSIKCWFVSMDEGGIAVVGERNPPSHQSFTDANWGLWNPLRKACSNSETYIMEVAGAFRGTPFQKKV